MGRGNRTDGRDNRARDRCAGYGFYSGLHIRRYQRQMRNWTGDARFHRLNSCALSGGMVVTQRRNGCNYTSRQSGALIG
jgi:hypothetical protein